MIGRPQAGWGAVARLIAHEMDVVNRNGAAGKHVIDSETQDRGRIKQTGGLTAGETRKRRVPLFPSIGEAGADDQLVSRKRRIGAVVADCVEIAQEHGWQRGVDRALKRLRRLRFLNREWR